MFQEGDTNCVEKLLKPAKRVLKVGLPLKHDAFDKRNELWNQIKINHDRYLDEDCGHFLKDLDNHFRSLFDAALLALAVSFKENGESFVAADVFSSKEIEIYEKIEQYNLFEILSADDIRKKLIRKDDQVLALLEDYYVFMDAWVEGVLNDPVLRLTLKFYLKKRWDGYKTKLNTAISSAITELDWLPSLITQWEQKSQDFADKRIGEVTEGIRTEIKDEVSQSVRDEKDRIAEKERDVGEREGKVDLRERDLADREKKIQSIRDKPDKKGGSRFVKLGEVGLCEMNFIGRLEHKLGGQINIFDRNFKLYDEPKELNTEDISGFRGRSDLTERDLKNIPGNRSLTARLVENKILGRKQRYTFRGLFASRVERYAEVGFDSDPLELMDVNGYLVDARDEAKESGEPMMLCLASPTGFEEAVGNYINSEDFHRNFTSKYLSVCLLDLETAKLLYNPNDLVAKEFLSICEMEMDAEKREKVRRCVKQFMDGALAVKDHVVLKDISDCGENAIVKALFYEYAEDRGWSTRYVDGVGLVMMK
ncbi:MAG: hypothetical protein U9N38_03735 [Thermodesulfobacteriota bacterium]|nr:hypothetical protein [Thermodesulfobacteriota bacterium]